jgi:hypothetical protein
MGVAEDALLPLLRGRGRFRRNLDEHPMIFHLRGRRNRLIGRKATPPPPLVLSFAGILAAPWNFVVRCNFTGIFATY